MRLIRLAPLTAVLVLAAAAPPALAATLVVDADGHATAANCAGSAAALVTIQSAVDAAAAADTVVVCPGTYHESVAVDKVGLMLLGPQHGVLANGRSGPEAVIDPGTSTDHGVRILRDGVTIDGFTITNTTPRPASERYGVCAASFCAAGTHVFDDGPNDTLDDV